MSARRPVPGRRCPAPGCRPVPLQLPASIPPGLSLAEGNGEQVDAPPRRAVGVPIRLHLGRGLGDQLEGLAELAGDDLERAGADAAVLPALEGEADLEPGGDARPAAELGPGHQLASWWRVLRESGTSSDRCHGQRLGSLRRLASVSRSSAAAKSSGLLRSWGPRAR